MDVQVTVTPAEMVAEYIALRDARDQGKKKFEEMLRARYLDRMDELETQLLDLLNKLGSDSIASPAGTVYKKLSTSVTVADSREFQRHVIGGELWDLIDWRANKTAVNDLIEAGEPVPPGINRSAFYSVGVRRKS
jgi:hypothetical protein